MQTVSEMVDWIFEGGDERLDILPSGNNKYHVNASIYEELFNRGSCTCSTLNPLTAKVLDNEEKFKDKNSIIKTREEQANRIKKLLNYEGNDAFGLIFAPSGSDLAYIPPLFSKVLYPQKETLLILTCPEELGSGSQMAYLGKYYAARNQFGEEQEVGDDINPIYDISMARFKARNDDGSIAKHSDSISDILNKDPNKSKIGALVIGSKSGIEDDISVIPPLSDEVMWVVDLCQFRNSKRLVNHLLEMGCMVMITGSKFYMAPPFCGVMLVPKPLCKKINEASVDTKYLRGFSDVFSYYDFTNEFSNFKNHFRKEVNKGLGLRWEIALNEMERFNQIPRENINNIIETWNKSVAEFIAQSEYLELMPHQEKTNQSIISFRVKTRFGTYMSYQDLKVFYKVVVGAEHNIGKFKKIFMGQPVKYGCGAFIRVAIGAYNIYQLLKKEENIRFENDKKLIQILDLAAGDFL